MKEIRTNAAGAVGSSPWGRFTAVGITLVIFVGLATVTRIVLFAANLGVVADAWLWWLPALAVGLLLDIVTGLWLLAPGTLFLVLMPDRWMRARFWRWLCGAWLFAYIFGLLYLGFVEWFFFDEFSARFNSVAVDYLIFPHEVFVNLWETYPVWQVLVFVGLVSMAAFWYLRPRFLESLARPTPRRLRWRMAGGYILVLAAAWFLVSARLAKVSDNRVLNEVALNGVFSFANAAMNNELDYDAYYSRVDIRDAVAELRRLLSSDGSVPAAADDSLSIKRLISNPEPARPLNVVIVLEESLGSRFVKSLTPDGPGVTPELERLADRGLLFTQIYATGNRTVRGMEAVLAGFPPIPGQSIVRRPGGRHIFSLPALLKSLGYSTAFVYGGLSYFDNMGDFALANGFDRVYDRTDFPKKTFTTIWGVCDEDLFDNSLQILDSLERVGKPFFSLLLTVSNHSPFTFPEGRLAPEYAKANRDNAVRYADYSLGKFLSDAGSHEFFKNTLFVVLGDHGPRVYGSQQIPLASYRIPVLFYAPGIIPAARNNVLGSQLDVPSTIMGVLRQTYVSSFFGRDLLAPQNDSPLALLSHNRDVALYRDHHMAVLGLGQDEELWQIDSVTGSAARLSPDVDPQLLRDAIAYYQSAYYLYEHRLLRPPEAAPSGSGARASMSPPR